MVLLVRGAHLSTAYELNVANILSIEGALLIAFLLHSTLTWHFRFTSIKEVLIRLFEVFPISSSFSL